MVTLDADFHVSPLWSFSLEHYEKPGVKDACLALQNEHRLDASVALSCVWHERRGGTPFDEQRIARILDTVQDPLARVWGIRPLREDAKFAEHGEALYHSLLRAELLAENLLQRALYTAIRDEGERGAASNGRTSLAAYVAQQRRDVPPPLLEAFTRV